MGTFVLDKQKPVLNEVTKLCHKTFYPYATYRESKVTAFYQSNAVQVKCYA